MIGLSGFYNVAFFTDRNFAALKPTLMKTKFCLIFFLSLISCFAVRAQEIRQTIKGKVIDTDTRQSLPGAYIIIAGSDPLIGTVTDEDGNFRLPPVAPGRYTLVISFTGYHSLTIPELAVSSAKEVMVYPELKEKILEAKEVVISANAGKDQTINAMTAISARSFSVEETRRYAGSADDPLRAASAFAGVGATAASERNDIVIRGNHPKGLLWRLEGTDIPNPNHFARVGNSGGGLTLFSSQVVSNSDFLTSAFPAEYGEALAGVFDIRFRNGNPDKREYTLQLGTLGIDASAEGPFVKGKAATFLFNYRYSSLALLAKVDKEFEKTIPDYQDLSFKIHIPLKKAGTLSITGIGGIDHSGLEAESDTLKWSNYEDRQQTKLNTSTGALILSHIIHTGKRTWMKTTLAASGSLIDYEDGFWLNTAVFRRKDASNTENTKLSASWVINGKPANRLTYRGGVTYNRMGYTLKIQSEDYLSGQFATLADESGNASSVQVFAQSRYDILEELTFHAGLHSRWFETNDKISIEPRVSLKWEFLPGNALSIGYGLHTQTENLAVYLTSPVNRTHQPNKRLDFANANHFILGYDKLINKNTRLKTELYYQSLSKLPVVPGSPVALINTVDQWIADSLTGTGTGKNYGIEFTLERFFSKGYYYLLTTSLYRAKYTGGDGIERNARFDGRFVINGLFGKEFTVRQKHVLGINLKASWNGGECNTPILLEQSQLENRQIDDLAQAWSERMESFVYTDITITFKRNHRKYTGSWALQIKNVLNHRPAIGYRYNAATEMIESILPMGMVPALSYKIEF